MPIAFKKVKPHEVLAELGIHFKKYLQNYVKISQELIDLQENENVLEFNKILKEKSEEDFFFFCYFVLDLPVNEPFLIQRCYDIQAKPFNVIELWSRDHYKSTIRTFAKTLWDLMKNQEERIVIFSHSRDIAKSFLKRIMTEMEMNEKLSTLWPDVFWVKPQNESPKWNENSGLVVKRKKNWAESSVEAWGVIDKMPTGKHFTIAIYDDLVTEKAIMTKGQMEKVETQFNLSHRLRDSVHGNISIIGTRYSHKDLYGKLIKERKWETRLFPSEVNAKGEGVRGGIPVLLTTERLQEQYEEMGPYLYNCQCLQNPTPEGACIFKRSWLRFWYKNKPFLNYYIICDPASTVGKNTAYTCMMVIGLDALRNFWIIDIIRDKMELGDKWNALKSLIIKYKPKTVGYEKNQAASDIQYYEMMQKEDGIFFNLLPIGKWKNKEEEIAKLSGLFEQGRIVFPQFLNYTDTEGQVHNLVQEFIEDEYLIFPTPSQSFDMLDVLAHLLNPEMLMSFPTRQDIPLEQLGVGFDPLDMHKGIINEMEGTWMSW